MYKIGNITADTAELAVQCWIDTQRDSDFNLPGIEIVRTSAIATVNDWAGAERSKVGTDIPFQGDVYQLKEKEAAAWFAEPLDPDPANYPVLYSEAAARNMEPAAVAAEWAYNAQAWPVIIAQIEGARLGAIETIKNATAIGEIEAALKAAVDVGV